MSDRDTLGGSVRYGRSQIEALMLNGGYGVSGTGYSTPSQTAAGGSDSTPNAQKGNQAAGDLSGSVGGSSSASNNPAFGDLFAHVYQPGDTQVAAPAVAEKAPQPEQKQEEKAEDKKAATESNPTAESKQQASTSSSSAKKTQASTSSSSAKKTQASTSSEEPVSSGSDETTESSEPERSVYFFNLTTPKYILKRTVSTYRKSVYYQYCSTE